MMIRVIPLLLILCLLLLACDTKNNSLTDSNFTTITKDLHYTLKHVDFVKLFRNRSELYNSNHWTPCDSNGVVLYEYEGQYYYHPVLIAYKSLQALSDYYNTHDLEYLNYAVQSARTLHERAIQTSHGLYFPYEFTYAPHGSLATYYNPWFSGLAQGMMLSVYSRLYFFTRDNQYKVVADSILSTMSDFESSYSTVYVTQDETLGFDKGYYWVDEYPQNQRNFTLNGSIIGSFGLFDHWWVFGDAQSKMLFSEEMTTIKNNILLFRVPQQPSLYDLKFRWKDPAYHSFHQILLDYCYDFTGDLYFQAISDLFYYDYH